MAGSRELEGPEIGSLPMSSEWPTACSRNTGMFCRMKRPRPGREAVCRCSGPRFPSERNQSLSSWFSPLTPKDQPKPISMARWGCQLLATNAKALKWRGSIPPDLKDIAAGLVNPIHKGVVVAGGLRPVSQTVAWLKRERSRSAGNPAAAKTDIK